MFSFLTNRIILLFLLFYSSKRYIYIYDIYIYIYIYKWYINDIYIYIYIWYIYIYIYISYIYSHFIWNLLNLLVLVIGFRSAKYNRQFFIWARNRPCCTKWISCSKRTFGKHSVWTGADQGNTRRRNFEWKYFCNKQFLKQFFMVFLIDFFQFFCYYVI